MKTFCRCWYAWNFLPWQPCAQVHREAVRGEGHCPLPARSASDLGLCPWPPRSLLWQEGLLVLAESSSCPISWILPFLLYSRILLLKSVPLHLIPSDFHLYRVACRSMWNAVFFPSKTSFPSVVIPSASGPVCDTFEQISEDSSLTFSPLFSFECISSKTQQSHFTHYYSDIRSCGPSTRHQHPVDDGPSCANGFYATGNGS